MLADVCCAVAIARRVSLHTHTRKMRRTLRHLVRSASLHLVSLFCFGLLFLRQRLGGGALVAVLAERLGAGVFASRSGALSFDELVVRRVFGGRGVEAMARSMRVEMMRMLQTLPVCAYMVSLQVNVRGPDGRCVWCLCDYCLLFVPLTASCCCRRRREVASQERGHLVL